MALGLKTRALNILDKLPTTELHSQTTRHNTGSKEKSLPLTAPTSNFSLDFPELREINLLIYKLSSLWCFVLATKLG